MAFPSPGCLRSHSEWKQIGKLRSEHVQAYWGHAEATGTCSVLDASGSCPWPSLSAEQCAGPLVATWPYNICPGHPRAPALLPASPSNPCKAGFQGTPSSHWTVRETEAKQMQHPGRTHRDPSLENCGGSTQCQTPSPKLSEFQSLICTLAASTLSGGLLEMQILRLHPSPEIETHNGAQHTVLSLRYC